MQTQCSELGFGHSFHFSRTQKLMAAHWWQCEGWECCRAGGAAVLVLLPKGNNSLQNHHHHSCRKSRRRGCFQKSQHHSQRFVGSRLRLDIPFLSGEHPALVASPRMGPFGTMLRSKHQGLCRVSHFLPQYQHFHGENPPQQLSHWCFW